MTTHSTPTGDNRKTQGSPADLVERLRSIAERAHHLQEKAALIGAELASLQVDTQRFLAVVAEPRPAYTAEEAAAAIGVDRITVYSLFGSGRLPTFRRSDGIRRVLVDDVADYLRSCRGVHDDLADAHIDTAGPES